MVARENIIFVVSWLALLVFTFISVITDTVHSTVIWFLVIAGFGFLLPQAYLAVTDDTVPVGLRLRTGVALTFLVAILGFHDAPSDARVGIAAICAGLFGSLLCYEFVTGYRGVRATP